MNLFKNLGNLTSLLGQAQQMGGKMEEIKEELRAQRVEGHAGGGLVAVEMNGVGEVLKVKLDPSLVEKNEVEMLEDLIPAAVNAAIQKAKAMHAEKLQSITSDLNLPIPGIQEAIAKFAGIEDPSATDPESPAGPASS